VSAKKERVDLALVERGLAESRAKAQALVMAGVVFAGERRVEKPGQLIAKDQGLEVRGAAHPWVSPRSASTSAPPPGASPMFCWPAGRVGFMRSMSVRANWPGGCAATRASLCWRRRTPAI
jgi:ribosomal protein S4